MLKPGQDFDFPQSPLTVRLMLKRGDLFDGYPLVFAFGISDDRIDGRTGEAGVSTFRITGAVTTYTTIP